jgi:putative nucleotidyltransferase with HDIG domain
MTLERSAVLDSVRDLPALPAVVLALIESLNDPDCSAVQLAEHIGRDQALAARTLRLANSPFYGRSRRVGSLEEAATLLGLRSLRSVAVAAGLQGSLPAPRCAGFDFPGFWRHGLATALAAGGLARRLNLDEGQAFTAGLLHDIGQLALACGFPGPYAEALRLGGAEGLSVLDAERAGLGIDHAAVGGLISEHWRFAPDVTEAIAGHHQAATAGATAEADLHGLIVAADALAHALDGPASPDDHTGPPPSAAELGLDAARWADLLAETRTQHEALCAAILS